MSWKIPLFDADFGPEEVQAVSRVVESGWLTMGEQVREFERQFADYIGVKHAVAVSSCTAALHLANMALGLGPGDEVICPSLTFVATANAIKYVGAKPVFADVKSLDEWLISLETIEPVRSPKTKAICVVHYAGYPCEMDAICDYAEREGLYVIEDCAHAPGARYKGKSVGSWGNIGCFSFFSNKNLSTGEGGMLTTNDDDLAARLRLFRSHGMTSVTLVRHKGHAFGYDVVNVGYNYRPTEITAALGLVQLKKMLGKNSRRQELVQEYRKALKDILPDVLVPFSKRLGAESAAHIMPVLLPSRVDRHAVMTKMRDAGIQTSIHYRPIHSFSAYKACNKATNSKLDSTETVGRRCLTLPLYPAMSCADVHYCVEILSLTLSG